MMNSKEGFFQRGSRKRCNREPLPVVLDCMHTMAQIRFRGLPILSYVWEGVSRVLAGLESLTLIPFATIAILPFLIYVLATRGYYRVFFAATRDQDPS